MILEENFKYKGWEKCIRLRTKEIEIIITTEVGPRIISLGFIDGANVFAQFAAQLGNKGQDSWQIYGGHRFWHAPEANPRTYYPDNDPVSYEIGQDGINLVQESEPTTNFQKEIKIQTTNMDNHLILNHKLTNRNLWSIKVAPWALSVMAQGGFAVFPQEPYVSHDDCLLPVRPMVLWAFTDMNDKRWQWGSRYITLTQDKRSKTPQKIGFANSLGWAAYVLEDIVFIKRYNFEPGKEYADFGCNTETYTDPDMLEVETLGPIEEIRPFDSIMHTEHWFLFRATVEKNEESIAEVIEPLVAMTQDYI